MRKRSRKKPAPRRRSKRRGLTPEDLSRVVFVGGQRVSPDGERIVFVHKQVGKKNEYVTNLWMVDSNGKSEPRQFTSGGKDGSPRWSSDGEQVAFTRTADGRTQLCTIPADGGEAKQLTQLPEGTVGDYRWSPDGSKIAVSFREQHRDWTKQELERRKKNGLGDAPWVLDDWWYRLDGDGYFGDARFQLYLIDVGSGKHQKIYDKDTLGGFTFDFSPDSSKIAITTNRHRKAMITPTAYEILIYNISSGKLRPVPGLPEGPKEAISWSPNGKWLAYSGRKGDDDSYSVRNLHLWICDPVRGKARSLTRRTDYCLAADVVTDMAELSFLATLEWSPDSRRIYINLGWHGETHVASVSRGGDVRTHTSGLANYDLGNVSRDGKTFALAAATPDRPSEIFVGVKRGEAIRTKRLTDLNGPLLKEIKVARTRSHWLRTPDGTKVHTWVMTPPDAPSSRRLPAILEIHGGPHAQYGVGFFFEFQLLASNGYMVFFSNPRGSKGYGEAHTEAIRGNWGDKDWIDIQTVQRFMQKHPRVNKKRMGVMGGSYGGYMTNWAIGHTKDFAGAITDRCVSNLHSMQGSSDFIEKPDHYFPGNAWSRPEELWRQSPLKYFGSVKTPTLIIHSEGDLRCNVEQAEQVFVALKLRNVPTRLVRYPRTTSHGMSRGGPMNYRQHRLHQILDWWSKYLKGRKRRA